MITRKNISNSYLSKKKRNRNKKGIGYDRVKQSGGASSVSTNELEERLNFFNEFRVEEVEAEADRIKKFFEKEIIPDIDVSGLVSADSSLVSASSNNKDNSMITFIDTHGLVKKDIKIVPHNTVICFLSPIDETFLVKDPSNYNSILTLMKNLTVEQFEEIASNKQNLRYGESEDISNIESYERDYLAYNCFRNSIWYHEGDEYPDLYISVNNKDIYSEGELKFPNTFYFQPMDIEIISNNVTTKPNNNFYEYKLIVGSGESSKSLPDDLLVKDNLINESEEIYSDSFAERLKYLDTPAAKTRILIVTACRNIHNVLTPKEKTELFERELYYFHKYSGGASASATGPASASAIKKFSSLTYCGTKKEYFYLSEVNPSYNMLLNSFKRHSYGGKIPSLMYLNEKYKTTHELSVSDYNYLHTFSIQNIIMFFNVLGGSGGSGSGGSGSSGSVSSGSSVSSVSSGHWYQFIKSMGKVKELYYKLTNLRDYLDSPAILYFIHPSILLPSITNLSDNLVIFRDAIYKYFEKIEDESELENIGELMEIIQNIIYSLNSYLEQPKISKSIYNSDMTPDAKDNIIELIIYQPINSFGLSNFKKVKTLEFNDQGNIMIPSWGQAPDFSNIININVYNCSIFNYNFSIFSNLISVCIYLPDFDPAFKDIYIQHAKLKNIKIEGSGNNLLGFFFDTPLITNIKFDCVEFINDYNFNNFWNILENMPLLKELSFINCHGEIMITKILFNKLKNLKTLKELNFENCFFNIDEKDKKDILTNIVKSVPEDISSIKLFLDGPDIPFLKDVTPEDLKDFTDIQKEIYKSLAKDKFLVLT